MARNDRWHVFMHKPLQFLQGMKRGKFLRTFWCIAKIWQETFGEWEIFYMSQNKHLTLQAQRASRINLRITSLIIQIVL